MTMELSQTACSADRLHCLLTEKQKNNGTKAKKKLAIRGVEKRLNSSDAMHVSMAVLCTAVCQSAGCK